MLTQSLAMRYENVDLIGELRAQSEAAESARAAAESANRAKSQFLAAASHDLRQPMHAMGLLATALATKARDPELRPLVASIQASVDALERLFGQLLDLSRLEGGMLRPARAEVSLATLFERPKAEFAPQAIAQGLALRSVPEGKINFEAEAQKTETELIEKKKYLNSIQAKLKNKSFVDNVQPIYLIKQKKI